MLPLDRGVQRSQRVSRCCRGLGAGERRGSIADRLSSAPQVPGRLERLLERPAVLRDYAHTPDALDRAIDAVRPFARDG